MLMIVFWPAWSLLEAEAGTLRLAGEACKDCRAFFTFTGLEAFWIED